MLGTMGCALEASPERPRDHLRRPDADRGQLIVTATYTVNRHAPVGSVSAVPVAGQGLLVPAGGKRDPLRSAEQEQRMHTAG
jgi:hypothetical protein